MYKQILATVAALFAAAAFAATDVNKATQAELEAIKGVGPGIAGKILDERKKGSFKDWNDFVERVKGVGEANAAKFSAEGMTVGGAAFKGAAPAAKPAAPMAAKAEAKPAAAAPVVAKAEAKPAVAAPVAAKAEAKPAAAPMAAKAEAKPAAAPMAAKADAKPADKPAAAAKAATKPDAAASAAKK